MWGKARREEIRRIHQKHKFFYEMLGGSVVLIISVLIGAVSFGANNPDFRMNLFTESMGIVATVFMINRWYGHRERENLKRRLIREVGSRSHDIAISAVEWMDREGWLRGEDGLLKGADLREAQLMDARMNGANLEKAEMRKADLRFGRLKDARFHSAQLPEARLFGAKLSHAKMRCAYLHSASAERADFSHACLDGATMDWLCLRGGNLSGACFRGASLHAAKLNGAGLSGADFYNADLTMSELRDAKYHNKANWEGAKLRYVDLHGVDFSDANMKGADLECANLEAADFWGTDFRDAMLLGAKLRGAKINPFDPPEESIFDGPEFEGLAVYGMGESHKTNLLGATLPDGTVFTVDMDYKELHRFTSPHDPQFDATLASIEAYRNRP